MDLICRTDPRRDAVRRMKGRNGLDYVEFDNATGPTLYVYFLGKLPAELATKTPASSANSHATSTAFRKLVCVPPTE